MKKTNLFAVLALAATPALLHAQTTNFSDIVGYTTLNVRGKTGSLADPKMASKAPPEKVEEWRRIEREASEKIVRLRDQLKLFTT